LFKDDPVPCSYLHRYSWFIHMTRTRDSSVSIVTRLRAGRPGFATVSRPVLGPTQPPTKWLSGDPSVGVKQRRCEADHSPSFNAEVKNTWSYNSTSPYVFVAWCLITRYVFMVCNLIKHRYNFNFFTQMTTRDELLSFRIRS